MTKLTTKPPVDLVKENKALKATVKRQQETISLLEFQCHMRHDEIDTLEKRVELLKEKLDNFHLLSRSVLLLIAGTQTMNEEE